MNYADLHCHTNLSDSLFSVPELFRHAAKVRIRYLAVSDHNRLISESEYKLAEHKRYYVEKGMSK